MRACAVWLGFIINTYTAEENLLTGASEKTMSIVLYIQGAPKK